MKRILLGALVAVGLLVGASTTQAGIYDTQGINCSALNGTPKMCIKNGSLFPIVDVVAVPKGFVFNPGSAQWIHVPGGAIPPGGMTIVTFPVWQNGTSVFDIYVRDQVGQVHRFSNVDVVHYTSLAISW